ncbi:MAG: hypothetical protein ACRDI2_02835 [Chloroflexota bacterium]
MLRDPRAETTFWPKGLSKLSWSEDERAYTALLDALAKQRVDAEAVALEMDTRSRRTMADVKEEELAVAQDQMEDARQHLHAFRDALEDARGRAAAAPKGEVAYDSTDPAQNARADLLIQYLVRTGYGEVRTEEPSPGQYVYYLRIAWDRLRQLAEQEGHTLPL